MIFKSELSEKLLESFSQGSTVFCWLRAWVWPVLRKFSLALNILTNDYSHSPLVFSSSEHVTYYHTCPLLTPLIVTITPRAVAPTWLGDVCILGLSLKGQKSNLGNWVSLDCWFLNGSWIISCIRITEVSKMQNPGPPPSTALEYQGDGMWVSAILNFTDDPGVQLDLEYPLGPLLSVISSFSLAETLLNRPQRQKDSPITLAQWL